MKAEKPPSDPGQETAKIQSHLRDSNEGRSFFRQSSWMISANIVGSICILAVQAVIGNIPESEFTLFNTLLQAMHLMMIPALGIQAVFAYQAASAVNEQQRLELATVLKGVIRGTFYLWCLATLLSLPWMNFLIAQLRIINPWVIPITILSGLMALWMPISLGILQGFHNFFWLGNAGILNGIIRLGVILILVFGFSVGSAGAMTAVILGMAAAVGAGWYQYGFLLRCPRVDVDWKAWWKPIIPMTLALGAPMVLLYFNMVFVYWHLPVAEAKQFAAADNIARGLVTFTTPIAGVMFPKIVTSQALSKSNRVLWLSVIGTMGLAGAIALVCYLFPHWPIRIIYFTSYLKFLQAEQWVRLYVWAVVPWPLTFVLINFLAAKRNFSFVPWAVAVITAYLCALLALPYYQSDLSVSPLKTVLMIIGASNLALLAVCVQAVRRSGKSIPSRTGVEAH
ncbi:MAG TPA: hypothetical protein EYQ50_06545 [Verrucomicrobiales bacterium]|nr:hypothetical protein [Verrucomicrobiales bacterium]HIL71785.1 hypothetical protein [Verrucomicrobiota bacterium]